MTKLLAIIALWLMTSLATAPLARAGEYVLLDGQNTILQRGGFDTRPPDPVGKGWRWFPVFRTDPPYDAATQVKTGPVTTIGPSDVTMVWTVRAKTAQELDDAKGDKISAIDMATFRALCHLKNETRRLSTPSLPAWTQAECLTAFKSLLP